MAPPTTPDKYPTADMFTEIVSIDVGVEPAVRTFKAHKSVLCFYSGYFEAAFKPNTFKEGVSGVLKLPEEDVDIFQHVMGWLYTRHLQAPEGATKAYRMVYELWAFGDRRDIPLLRNEMINAIRDTSSRRKAVPTSIVPAVYASTTAGSLLRRFVIYLISRNYIFKPQDIFKPERPAEYYWDVLQAVSQLWKAGVTHPKGRGFEASEAEMARVDLCQFHTHPEGVTCQPATST